MKFLNEFAWDRIEINAKKKTDFDFVVNRLNAYNSYVCESVKKEIISFDAKFPIRRSIGFDSNCCIESNYLSDFE